jgi:hypothetical protein
MALDRDSRWVWAGFALSVALLAGVLGFWTSWFGLTSPRAPGVVGDQAVERDAATTSTGSGGTEGSADRSLGADLVQFVLPAALAGGVVLWLGWSLRDRRPRFGQLPPEEQRRRREAGRILREVVPPVSEEEARRMLAPPWERGPDDWPRRGARPGPGGGVGAAAADDDLHRHGQSGS